jgi:serine/threonine-protein kinase
MQVTLDAQQPIPVHRQPVRFGPYEILEEIGRGGMATVDRAVLRRENGFERQLVIKRILRELAANEQFIRMFINEARLCALLDHPNIVKVHDFGSINGVYFLAMEHIHGLSLADLLNHHGALPPRAALFIAHKVCAALAYAQTLWHNSRPLTVIHRDISPGNIMVSAQGEVKVLDFGIAKAMDAVDGGWHTVTGGFKGKVSYVSPEQAMGKPVTAQSDIFSIGIVLWEMTTGKRLFKADSDYLTLNKIVREEIPTVRSVRADVPAPLDEICARALARNPTERYQTPLEMANDLEGMLARHYFSASRLASLVQPSIELGVSAPRPPSDSRPSLACDITIEYEDGAATGPGATGVREGRGARRTLAMVLAGLAAAAVAAGAVFLLGRGGDHADGEITARKPVAPVAPVVQQGEVAPERKEEAQRRRGGALATPDRAMAAQPRRSDPDPAMSSEPRATSSELSPKAPPPRQQVKRSISSRKRKKRRRHRRPRAVPDLKGGALADPFD